MNREPERDALGHQLFLAGTRAPAGRYQRVDGPQVLHLDHEEVLPAAFDGHITCYMRVQTWRDRQCLIVAPQEAGSAVAADDAAA